MCVHTCVCLCVHVWVCVVCVHVRACVHCVCLRVKAEQWMLAAAEPVGDQKPQACVCPGGEGRAWLSAGVYWGHLASPWRAGARGQCGESAPRRAPRVSFLVTPHEKSLSPTLIRHLPLSLSPPSAYSSSSRPFSFSPSNPSHSLRLSPPGSPPPVCLSVPDGVVITKICALTHAREETQFPAGAGRGEA